MNPNPAEWRRDFDSLIPWEKRPVASRLIELRAQAVAAMEQNARLRSAIGKLLAWAGKWDHDRECWMDGFAEVVEAQSAALAYTPAPPPPAPDAKLREAIAEMDAKIVFPDEFESIEECRSRLTRRVVRLLAERLEGGR